MPTPARIELHRIKFSHADFLKLPKEVQLLFVRLAHVTDDLRHVFYLCVAAEKGTRSHSPDERKLALHQLLFGVRLIYSILYEGWNVIKDRWKGTALGKTWDSRLSEDAREGLKYLGKYFGQSKNLSRTVRNKFGFHYSSDLLREPLASARKRSDEIITGNRSANIFYPFAEEIRALALLQATLPKGAPKLWEENVSEADIRKAAIALYESFKPVRNAFDAFSNSVLTQVVKSLPRKTERFVAPSVTKFSEMLPVLFVEEPGTRKA
jgi:hypothetical protein